MRRCVNIPRKAAAGCLVLMLSAGPAALQAKTVVGGGLQVAHHSRSLESGQVSGIDFGPSMYFESGFFPGNIAMAHQFGYQFGRLDGNSRSYSHESLTFSHAFKYYFPSGYSLGGWWRKSVYPLIDKANPYLGPVLGMSLDLRFADQESGREEFNNEFDFYLGGTLGCSIIITDTLIVVPELMYMVNLMPDDSDNFRDDAGASGGLFQFTISAGYMYDL